MGQKILPEKSNLQPKKMGVRPRQKKKSCLKGMRESDPEMSEK
jgi:hypothetical protein